MAIHSLSPGFVKVYYIGPQNIQHIATYPVSVASLSGTPTLNLKGGSTAAWDTSITAWITALKAVVPATVTFQYGEFWSQPTPADDPVYIATVTLNAVGTNAAASVANSMLTFSFRTSAGGNGKVILLEASYAVNNVYKPPTYSDAAKLAVVTYLTGNTNPIYGRDGGWPVVVTRIFTKTSDAMRKRTILNAP